MFKTIKDKISPLMKGKSHTLAFALLALIAVVVHREWFFSTGVLSWGDWNYYFHQTQRELLTLPSGWLNNAIGSVNVGVAFYPLNFGWGLLSLFSGYAISERIIFLWPCAIITPIAGYVLAYKFVHNRLAAVLGSLLFSYNTYILLLQTQHLTLSVAFAVAPLFFVWVIDAVENKGRDGSGIKAILSGFVVSFYDFRVLYISTGLLVLYFIYSILISSTRRILPQIRRMYILGPIFAILGLLSAYWLLGLSFTHALSNNGVIGRGLFGNDFMNITQAMNLFHPWWTNAKPVYFIVQAMPIYFWLIPLIAVSGLIIGRNNKAVIFFGLVAIIGILLTKQVGQPFPQLYLFLFDHVPGFNAFREASKFFFVVAFGYTVLFASLADWLTTGMKNQGNNLKTLGVAGCVAIGVVALVNVTPLITGSFGTMFRSRNIPQEYKKLESFIADQAGYFRTLWLPSTVRWAYSDSSHPQVSAASGISDWLQIANNQEQSTDIALTLGSSLESPIARKLISDAAIKYIVVPTRDTLNDGDIFGNYGYERSIFVEELDRLGWLSKKELGADGLDVYENKSAKPYVTSFDELVNLKSAEAVKTDYAFYSSQFARDFQYRITGNDGYSGPGSALQDLFATPDQLQTAAGVISAKIDGGDKASELYRQVNAAQIEYRIDSSGIVTLESTTSIQPSLAGKALGVPAGRKLIGSVPVAANSRYFWAVDSLLTPLNTNLTSEVLGTSSQDIRLVSSSGVNILGNGSFENGGWTEKVRDCDNFDSNGTVGMRVSTSEHTDGSNSIELDSLHHSACTSQTNIPVKPNADYSIEFDYKTIAAKQIEYDIEFNDAKRTTLKYRIPANRDEWKHIGRQISSPAGATNMSLTIIGAPSEQQNIMSKTYYDNFQIQRIETSVQAPKNSQNLYVRVQLDATRGVDLNLLGSGINPQNLIENGSLENGLWQDKVGDCNNNDAYPSIGMRLNKQEKTDGAQSLELAASNHTACTGPPDMPVTGGNAYSLGFDYKSPNGQDAGYYVQFNDPDKTVITEHIPASTKWKRFSKTLTAPLGATTMSLTLYAFPEDKPSTKKIVDFYDNFKVINVPDVRGQYYFYSGRKQEIAKPGGVTFKAASSTRKTISVSNATSPFYLAMAEAYHPNWRLDLNNSKAQGLLNSWVPWAKPDAIPEADHFKLNDFENGWYIDVDKLCKQQNLCTKNADGTYDIQLVAEFTPQRWFYIGLIISGVTLAGCLGYLGWYVARRRRRTTAPSAQPTHRRRPITNPHDVRWSAHHREIDLRDK